jgi:hypothetical protein
VPIICLTSTAGPSAVVPCPSAIAAGTAIINPEMEAINALKNIKKEKVDPIKHSYLNQFREICYVPYVSNDTIFHATASVLAFFDLP